MEGQAQYTCITCQVVFKVMVYIWKKKVFSFVLPHTFTSLFRMLIFSGSTTKLTGIATT